MSLSQFLSRWPGQGVASLGAKASHKNKEATKDAGRPAMAKATTFCAGGISLVLCDKDPESLPQLDLFTCTGSFVWPPAPVLAEYMAGRAEMFHGETVLELGAGQGLCGLVAASLGATTVCLTDRLEPAAPRFPVSDPDAMSDAYQDLYWNELLAEYASQSPDVDRHNRSIHRPGSDRLLKALQGNIDRNLMSINERRGSEMPGANIVVEELEFGDQAAAEFIEAEHGPFDIIIGSDITYLSMVRPLLMSTLQQLCGASAHVLLAHMGRNTRDLLSSLHAAGLAATVVHRRADVSIIECTRM